MPFCSKCGNEIGDGVSFCPKCGNPASGQLVTSSRKIPKQMMLGAIGAVLVILIGILFLVINNDPKSMLIGQWVAYVDDDDEVITITFNKNGTGKLAVTYIDGYDTYEGENETFNWYMNNKTSITWSAYGGSETFTISELTRKTLRFAEFDDLEGKPIIFTKTKTKGR